MYSKFAVCLACQVVFFGQQCPLLFNCMVTPPCFACLVKAQLRLPVSDVSSIAHIPASDPHRCNVPTTGICSGAMCVFTLCRCAVSKLAHMPASCRHSCGAPGQRAGRLGHRCGPPHSCPPATSQARSCQHLATTSHHGACPTS